MGDSLGDNLMMMGSDILPEILLHDDGEREEASITEVVDFGFGDMDLNANDDNHIFPQEELTTFISKGGSSPIENNRKSDVFPNTLNTADVPSLIFEESAAEEEEEEETRITPRKVRRMMLESREDTVLPWELYGNTEHLILKNKQQEKKKKQENVLVLPSIAFNPFQKNKKIGLSGVTEEFAFFTIKRNRFIFPTTPMSESEFGYMEKMRRADSYQPSIASSSHHNSSGIQLRTSSDLTNTPDMHNLDLGDMDMQDAKSYREMPSFGFVDDFDYFDNDDGFQTDAFDNLLEENLFLQELRMWLENGFTVTDLIMSKDRSKASQCFYSLLELASKHMLRPHQTEPYGPIQVELFM
ncbi:uncharacterized protein EV154DRAFT_531594 [Mucor mucedo]|uniref:uncharacterized protein n=1 Tax=Mucor mucedo TaxID=29922 RepID=UPI0022208459|nr:uncharacterized protein EV154DRAFT_531594 [Mucor mucedo]KAI7867895.1 hypothetical protein EV154DRAFT_531594 [Mucor mucedo]